jgi:hypothetical protein
LRRLMSDLPPGVVGYGVHTLYLLIGTCESVDSSIL